MAAHRRLLSGIAVAFALLGLQHGVALGQVVDPNMWMTDGTVYCMAMDGTTLYLGGEFTWVGPQTGSFVGIDASSGVPRAGWPRVRGIVHAAVPDGAGGWYIGGDFTSVAGVPRLDLAHIRADWTLDAWDPGADGEVWSLAVLGSVVYAGGSFRNIGGQARDFIAALDATTGQATAWNPGVDNLVYTLLARDNTVYAGGYFTVVGGKDRSFVAAIDATTGEVTDWDAQVAFDDFGGYAFTIAVSGNTLYAAGEFTSVGGLPRAGLAAVDLGSGQVRAWNPAPNGLVMALAVSGSTVYVGGDFNHLGGQPRSGLAAVDAVSGQLGAWNPSVNSMVQALLVNGGLVYAGGRFSAVGGQLRGNVAAINAATGQVTAWNPNSNDRVWCLAANGNTIFAGGMFTGIGGRARQNIAAVDLASGMATSWNPGADASVTTLAACGSTVYAGGSFFSIGGKPIVFFAALDALTGQARNWDLGSASVRALAGSGSSLYVGGYFIGLDSQGRNNIGALDAPTGQLKPWDPDANQAVDALAVSGSTLYAGGTFTTIGGQSRASLAAFDTTTGLVTPWNPGADNLVDAIAASGSTVYVGGGFTNVGGQPRNGIAALDGTTGQPTAWNPGANPGGRVNAFALSGGTVYAGGEFGAMGGQPRSYIAALDSVTGQATAWNPGANYSVSAIGVRGADVYAAGRFTRIGGETVLGLAKLVPSPASPLSVETLSPNGGEYLVVGSTHRLSWNATAAYPGVQSVDLYLSRTGPAGPWQLLAAGAPNSGHYDWVVTGGSGFGSSYLRVQARDWAGALAADVSDQAFSIVDLTAVPGSEIAAAVALEAPAPNPVRGGAAAIAYLLPRPASVRLTVLDVQGREVSVLADGEQGAGRHVAQLQAQRLQPGLYFARLQAGGVDLKRRVVVIR